MLKRITVSAALAAALFGNQTGSAVAQTTSPLPDDDAKQQVIVPAQPQDTDGRASTSRATQGSNWWEWGRSEDQVVAGQSEGWLWDQSGGVPVLPVPRQQATPNGEKRPTR